MVVAYVFAELRQHGDLVVPGARIHLAQSVGFLPALVLALVTAAALGLLAHTIVFGPLRGAPPLARVVAAVGLTIALQAAVVLGFGTAPRSVAPILPNQPVHVLGATVARDRLWMAGLVVVLAGLLGVVYRRTTFGLATRAAADSETGAALLGWSPTRLAAGNWVIAAVLAGIAGVLVAPITALNPTTYTLLVVPALAAALAGRLTSFPATVTAGLALGMAQSELTKLATTFRWLPRLGLGEALPFVVVVVAIALAGSRLPARAAAPRARLPAPAAPGRPGRAAAVLLPAAVIAASTLQGGWRVALVNSMTGAVVCLSLVVLTGLVGQLSLAQMAFAGVAGFTLSRLAHGAGVPFPVAPLIASAAAAGLGVLVGVPALRVRGVSLAVVTLAAGVATEALVFRNPSYTGGLEGSVVPQPRLFGLDLGIRGRHPGQYPRVGFALLVLAVLAVLAVAVANLRRSTTGRRMLAVRANERAAAAAGVDTARVKLLAFALSAFVAGVAGTLVGYQQGRISFDSFGVSVSLGFLAYAYLGGIAGVGGALVGGLLVGGGLASTALDRWLGLGRFHLLLSGVGLVAVALLAPEGIAGAASSALRVARRPPKAALR